MKWCNDGKEGEFPCFCLNHTNEMLICGRSMQWIGIIGFHSICPCHYPILPASHSVFDSMLFSRSSSHTPCRNFRWFWLIFRSLWIQWVKFFLKNTNLTFLAFSYKIDIEGFQNQKKRESPPAWMQEASCPLCTPSSPGQGGYPHQVPMESPVWGVPHPVLGRGYPRVSPILTWDLIWMAGTPGYPHPDLGWGTPVQTWDGVPPPIQTWDGVPPVHTWEWGTPILTWDGVQTPPPSVNKHLKTVSSLILHMRVVIKLPPLGIELTTPTIYGLEF